MEREIEVAYRDDDLLVLIKPSGLPTTSPDESPCLATMARDMDKSAERMHPSSRLDAEVTGLVTFARTTRAIAALRVARARNEYQRLYLALAPSAPTPSTGRWDAAIGIDPRDPRRRVVVKPGEKRESKASSTRYGVRAQASNAVLMSLWPETGRTHQLRVHASNAGIPLLGDVHYGGKKHITTADGRVHLARRVMLHCTELVLPRVVGEGTITVRADVPKDMRALYLALGGDEAAFNFND